ncbi:MAG: hypothetical protein FWC00_03630 [Firmicutes bacterium]|nr:hypothetical protein [Bacillota bacterium]
MSKKLKIIVASCTAVLLVGGTILGLWLGGVFGRSGTPAWLVQARANLAEARFMPNAEDVLPQSLQNTSDNKNGVSQASFNKDFKMGRVAESQNMVDMNDFIPAHLDMAWILDVFDNQRRFLESKRNDLILQVNLFEIQHENVWNNFVFNSQLVTVSGLVDTHGEMRIKIVNGENYQTFAFERTFYNSSQPHQHLHTYRRTATIFDNGMTEMVSIGFRTGSGDGSQASIWSTNMLSRFNDNDRNFELFHTSYLVEANYQSTRTPLFRYMNFSEDYGVRQGSLIQYNDSHLLNGAFVGDDVSTTLQLLIDSSWGGSTATAIIQDGVYLNFRRGGYGHSLSICLTAIDGIVSLYSNLTSPEPFWTRLATSIMFDSSNEIYYLSALDFNIDFADIRRIQSGNSPTSGAPLWDFIEQPNGVISLNFNPDEPTQWADILSRLDSRLTIAVDFDFDNRRVKINEMFDNSNVPLDEVKDLPITSKNAQYFVSAMTSHIKAHIGNFFN